ncbi:MAG TPA: hypothetical protein VGL71_04830 [Urbifossiella sp.]
MFAFPLLLAAAIPSVETAPAPRSASVSEAEVRAAIGKSLQHLETSTAAWRKDRKCVSCHQVPFTIWSLTEARSRGFPVDDGRLNDLIGWAFNFCMTSEDKGQKNGGFHLAMVDMVLSQASAASNAHALTAYPFFETLFDKKQYPDGSWHEVNQIRIAGADREANEVDTMWTLLAIRELERLGEKLPAKTRKGLAAEREKALALLKDARPGRRIDWLALRAQIAREFGKTEESESLYQELRNEQNADGGWGYVRGGASYPHTTGECLYCLGSSGFTGNDSSVRRAWKFLVANQQTDGTWWALSRREFNTKPDKANDVTFHWGSGWATIGLLKTLPRK